MKILRELAFIEKIVLIATFLEINQTYTSTLGAENKKPKRVQFVEGDILSPGLRNPSLFGRSDFHDLQTDFREQHRPILKTSKIRLQATNTI